VAKLSPPAARIIWLISPFLFLALFCGVIGYDPTGISRYFETKPPPLASITKENFKFENFGSYRSDLVAGLNKIIPAGTPQTEVEKILIEQAGAQARLLGDDHGAMYSHKVNAMQYYLDCPRDMTWGIYVQYTKSAKLSWLKVSGPCM